MARLFWLAFMVALGVAVLVGASWAIAYNSVATLLGDPPPEMGKQYTTFLWQGAPELPAHQRAWRFVFGPTLIPGASTVRIYVTPLGHVLETQPADLEARVKALHPL